MAQNDGEEYRALLTKREKEILSGEADVSDGYYYRVVTRVRNKINQLCGDIETLDAHHSELASELRTAVSNSGEELEE